MITKDLIKKLKNFEPLDKMHAYCVVNDNYIDFDWYSDKHQTVQELIKALETQSLNDVIYVDVEDGITYFEVKGVIKRYYSKTLDVIDFITEGD